MKLYSTVFCLCLILFSATGNSYPIFLKGNHFEDELVIRLDAPEVIRGKVEKREVKVEDFTFNVNKSIDLTLDSKPHLSKYENE
ncbi:hypothetical protein KDD30_21715 (plasmid) [Photobacterium sp. GJ3]|uniref:hypothetical protein n=1 Tax=Photobacterium sp. GJ3 TaxID=2829502 RepID=UPI001B8C182A|nr:hypothetical protein [Photobacterium sp. GJ3]QUJ69386.1 hypothetical protein KDD30_21715 [Photobacterium sp. GJ3]